VFLAAEVEDIQEDAGEKISATVWNLHQQCNRRSAEDRDIWRMSHVPPTCQLADGTRPWWKCNIIHVIYSNGN